LPPHHLVEIDGLPVTSLARTVFDLCGLASVARRQRGLPWITEPQASRALDDALAGPLTVAAANRILAELGRRGRPGTALMRRLMDERGEGFVATESELEDLLVAVLRDTGLPIPARQRSLGGVDAPVGRVDFLFAEHRVVIEADGRRNHTALMDAEHDRWRDLELGAAGFLVVRVSWHQLVHQPERFVAMLRRVLATRAPTTHAAGS
jgi:very-short-patch-repair endonuclease